MSTRRALLKDGYRDIALGWFEPYRSAGSVRQIEKRITATQIEQGVDDYLVDLMDDGPYAGDRLVWSVEHGGFVIEADYEN